MNAPLVDTEWLAARLSAWSLPAGRTWPCESNQRAFHFEGRLGWVTDLSHPPRMLRGL